MAKNLVCKYCGREENSISSNPEDHCQWVGKYSYDLKEVRSPSCYEYQLATLTAWAQEAVKVLEEISSALDDGRDIHIAENILTQARQLGIGIGEG